MTSRDPPLSCTEARLAASLRPATLADIPAMQRIRLAVRENRLVDPARVTPADYVRYVEQPGASWVVEREGRVVGFGIADLRSRSLWALFVDPPSEGRGIGRALLERLTACLFEAGAGRINLSTAPGTRAERVYAAAGWTRAGMLPNGEAWLVRTRPGPCRDG